MSITKANCVRRMWFVLHIILLIIEYFTSSWFLYDVHTHSQIPMDACHATLHSSTLSTKQNTYVLYHGRGPSSGVLGSLIIGFPKNIYKCKFGCFFFVFLGLHTRSKYILLPWRCCCCFCFFFKSFFSHIHEYLRYVPTRIWAYVVAE